jgi:hypothetical protein
MNGAILSFANWLENTRLALAIADSSWVYPYVQLTHFVGLSLWVGTNVAVDLSLVGVGKGWQTPAEVSDALIVWNWIGFAIAVAGGLMLFAASATTYVINPAFLVKFGVLIPLALACHVIIQGKVHGWCQRPNLSPVAKLIGLTELVLWLAVITAAVLIPFLA